MLNDPCYTTDITGVTLMDDITYATKLWQGDLEALTRHPNADLVIANNTHAKIVDIGKTDPYFTPELEAVKRCETKYILWYSADVIPPETDWISEAIPLLEKYPIVTCLWEDNPDTEWLTETDFGWENYFFSDQCYIAKTKTMKETNYDLDHPIKLKYPKHGGNSFERRIAQWLAYNQTPMAVLKNHQYRHITQAEKSRY